MKATCVIPAFNAQETVANTVLRTLPFVDKVLVIDDGSEDQTQWIARDCGAEIVRLPTNQGKGRALRTGFGRALESGADVIVTIDADGENPPEDLPRILHPLTDGHLGAVLGARTQTHSSRMIGFKTTKLLLREMLGIELDDAMCEVRAYQASALRSLIPFLESRGFGIDLEIALRLILLEVSFIEVPISSEFLQPHQGFEPLHVEGFRENIIWFAVATNTVLNINAAELLEGVKRRQSITLAVGGRAHELHYNVRLNLYQLENEWPIIHPV
jgi:glycosyltransferase involved in cell wall biosynthesis